MRKYPTIRENYYAEYLCPDSPGNSMLAIRRALISAVFALSFAREFFASHTRTRAPKLPLTSPDSRRRFPRVFHLFTLATRTFDRYAPLTERYVPRVLFKSDFRRRFREHDARPHVQPTFARADVITRTDFVAPSVVRSYGGMLANVKLSFVQTTVTEVVQKKAGRPIIVIRCRRKIHSRPNFGRIRGYHSPGRR